MKIVIKIWSYILQPLPQFKGVKAVFKEKLREQMRESILKYLSSPYLPFSCCEFIGKFRIFMTGDKNLWSNVPKLISLRFKI